MTRQHTSPSCAGRDELDEQTERVDLLCEKVADMSNDVAATQRRQHVDEKLLEMLRGKIDQLEARLDRAEIPK